MKTLIPFALLVTIGCGESTGGVEPLPVDTMPTPEPLRPDLEPFDVLVEYSQCGTHEDSAQEAAGSVGIRSDGDTVLAHNTRWWRSVWVSEDDRFLASVDAMVYETSDVGDPGMDARYVWGFSLPPSQRIRPGVYYFIIVTDPGDSLPETDETNNAAVSKGPWRIYDCSS